MADTVEDGSAATSRRPCAYILKFCGDPCSCLATPSAFSHNPNRAYISCCHWSDSAGGALQGYSSNFRRHIRDNREGGAGIAPMSAPPTLGQRRSMLAAQGLDHQERLAIVW